MHHLDHLMMTLLIRLMMLDKVYSIFLVVYPDETVVIGYGEFES
jgi:hypothetical protein